MGPRLLPHAVALGPPSVVRLAVERQHHRALRLQLEAGFLSSQARLRRLLHHHPLFGQRLQHGVAAALRGLAYLRGRLPCALAGGAAGQALVAFSGHTLRYSHRDNHQEKVALCELTGYAGR